MIGVLTNLVIVVSPYTCIQNRHIEHFKLIQYYVNNISIKPEKRKKEKKYAVKLLTRLRYIETYRETTVHLEVHFESRC